MRKRISLLLVLLLSVILTVTLFACNQQTKNKDGELPPIVGVTPGGDDPSTLPSGNTDERVGLKFTFPIESSNIFNSIDVEKFKLDEYVEYAVVYTDESGATVREVPCGGVGESMVDEADREFLTKAGHHDIHVTATLDGGSTVRGMFTLHLKDLNVISLIKCTFNLSDANGGGVAKAYFGETDTMNSTVSVSIEDGTLIHDWNEFLNTFKMRLDAVDEDGNPKRMALESVRSGSTVINANSTFPIYLTSDSSDGLQFATAWTDDVVSVTYNLNRPTEATVQSGKTDPKAMFEEGGEYYGPQSVQRGVGYAMPPNREDLDVYNGYYFAGWFNSATEKPFDFTSYVGQKDIELSARWVAASYSFTLYTMGGEFAPNLQPSTENGVTITKDNLCGYTLIESTSRFGLSDGKLNRVTFTGFNYGIDYDRYVAEVTVSADGRKVMLKFSEIYNLKDAEQTVFVKGDGDCWTEDDLYSDYQCATLLERVNKVSTEQPIAYLGWNINMSQDESKNLERLSKLYTEELFKDGISVKADGSVRIDKISDYSVNGLIVPATLTVGGIERPLTEIGDDACSNVRALTKLDLSRASNLTRIGASAFAHDEYLSGVIWPTENNIAEVGSGAFRNTAFERDYYSKTNGAVFIVINRMIYKYVGEDTDEVDLNNPSGYYVMGNSPRMTPAERKAYNEQLEKVETIVESAFTSCKSLTTLSLPIGIKEIKNNAFYSLDKLVNLYIPKDSALAVIGEKAFDGSGIITPKSNVFFDDAIIIGSVYYRWLNTIASSVTVPSSSTLTVPERDANGEIVGESTVDVKFDIKYIASHAFEGCTALDVVVFANQSAILSVGRDAFLDTKFIQGKDGNDFTVINGILTAYYGPTQDASKNNLIVPSTVEVIAENAFSATYARYFSTLQINSTVTRIEDRAFEGAHSLKSIIFPDVTVGEGGKLEGAPAISDDTFANSKGEMFGATLFFSKDVIAYLKKLADPEDEETAGDDITLGWLNLYKMHTASFLSEEIAEIKIDSKVIANLLLEMGKIDPDTGEIGNAFTDKYPETVPNALIITNNTGVERRAPLEWKANDMEIVKDTKEGAGENAYLLKFKYNGSDEACVAYSVTIHKAIKAAKNEEDNLKFYTSANNNYETAMRVVAANGLLPGNSNYWIETFKGDKTESDFDKKDDWIAYFSDSKNWVKGFVGDVKNTANPTFYTSTENVRIRFAYKDISYDDGSNAEEQYRHIDISMPRDFNTQSTVPAVKETTVEVNFHEIGTYRFKLTYSVVMAKFISMAQKDAIVIPVNGTAADYLKDCKISLTSEDGSVSELDITKDNFRFAEVDSVPISNNNTAEISTSVLGMHKLKLEHSGSDTNGVLGLDVYYTVVPQADGSLFTYSLINERQKTVKITSCKAENPITVVVPSKYTGEVTKIVNGEETKIKGTFTVVQIGDMSGSAAGVFENFRTLTAVYLPETVKEIGINTFAGCTLLRNIYTASEVSADKISINNPTLYDSESNTSGIFLPEGSEYEEAVGESGKQNVQPVILMSLSGLTYTESLVIGGDYPSGKDGLIYRIVGIKDGLVIDAEKDKIDVYLPDTIYKPVNIVDKKGNTITPIFTASGSKFLFKTLDRVPDGLTHIAKGAFKDCASLSGIDLSKAKNLEAIGALAFYNSGIKSIDLRWNIKIDVINSQTFQNCSQLTEVLLPDSLKTIGMNAFDNCRMLVSVSGYKEALEVISAYAFNRCSSLERFDIFKGEGSGFKPVRIETNAFTDCNALTVFSQISKEAANGWSDSWNASNCPVVWNCQSNDRAEDGLVYAVIEGLRYSLDVEERTAALVRQSYSISGSVNVPQSVECKVIKKETNEKITMTFTVTAIGERAFANNDRLTGIKVPSTVISIAQYAFGSCTALSSFTFDGFNMLEIIAGTAFDGCVSLVSRPTIENKFAYAEISGIWYKLDLSKEIAIIDIQSPTLSEVVKIPQSVEYTVNVGGTYVKKTFTVTVIGARAFAGNESITKVQLPSTVTVIEELAFEGCTALKEISIEGKYVYAEISDIWYKLDLSEYTAAVIQAQTVSGVVVIPESVEYTLNIDGEDTQKSFTVTVIGARAFAGNESITKVQLPSTVTVIEELAFEDCTALEEISFDGANGLTFIAENAFEGCDVLETKPTVESDGE